MQHSPKLHFRRFEFKYLLPVAITDRLIPALLQYMHWDPYAGANHAYTVNSLYFDSPTFRNYFDKAAGVRQRKKFRLRIYSDTVEDSTPVFMEYKRKDNAIVHKDRIVHPWSEVTQLIAGERHIEDFPEEEHPFLEEFLMDQRMQGLKPVVQVAYTRKPLIGRSEDSLRITFDSRLQVRRAWGVGFQATTQPVLPHDLIMEIKYNNMLPVWVHRIIQQYQLQNDAHSKYCYGIDAAYSLITL